MWAFTAPNFRMTRSFLAFDLGAESGRTVYGFLKNRTLQLKQISRFPNEMLRVHGRWHWDILRLFGDMKKGMILCAQEGLKPDSVGIDTWGVDFALLAEDGSLLGLPYAYRDFNSSDIMLEVFEQMPRERIYTLTGTQFLPFNSLFQMYSLVQEESSFPAEARAVLFMPDLFNYLLTGEKATEYTYATTSQLYNPRRSDWEEEILDLTGLPKSLFQSIVPSGTIVGQLRPEIGEETGLDDLSVMAVASHDTASAVAAAPAKGEDWAYISSGTWSLLGLELSEPIINERALSLNFTNEGGVGGTTRFLKNICGLWLLQACRKVWEKDRPLAYAELISAAETAPAFHCLLDPDDPGFLNPPDMPEAILEYCSLTGQPVPESISGFVRCILESLAFKYRFVLDQLREVTSRPIRRIHVIGGGAQNRMLNQFTANATGLEVIAGPVEATAVGNILVQAFSQEGVVSLDSLRDVVRRSFPLVRYQPQETELWEQTYANFCTLINKNPA